ncbi:kinase-like domain-containing protein, partial [Sparassis latifolia]
DMTNQTIDNGRLRLMERLGEGGYGVVYRAVDDSSTTSSSHPAPKEYAVKVLVKAEPSGHYWHFQSREIAIHKFVSNHPNVLTLHEVIEDDWFIYLVLDYCPGGDLFTAIIERHSFCGKDDLVRKIFVQILDAVQHCHDKGIYHRDLKPENIMCSQDGTEIKLGDFGLATNSRMSNTFGCGSSYYVSPECIGVEFNKRPYPTQHSDTWALGIILTNMIAGRSPWSYATKDDQCFLRYTANPNYLREMLPISEGASHILKRVFTFDPYTRISIPELREEILKLERF